MNIPYKTSDTQQNYHAADLTFRENGDIVWTNPATNEVWEVMMEWEIPIMQKAAEVCVEAGDDVLECGFGMGILSDAIQARNPGTHTICETHPQIIPKLKAWAADKPNVIVVEDKWLSLLNERKGYDAILMDTYADPDLHPHFRYFVKQKAKDGAKITWWNFSGGTTDEWMKFHWDDVVFHDVAISPPENQYYNRNVYHVPLKIFNRPTGYGVLTSSNFNINETESKNLLDAKSFLTCDVSNGTKSVRSFENIERLVMNCEGLYTLNESLVIAGAHPIYVKRNNQWTTVKVNELVVGDKLYGKNGEIELTSKTFDSSETTRQIYKVMLNNYFVNDILVKGGSDA